MPWGRPSSHKIGHGTRNHNGNSVHQLNPKLDAFLWRPRRKQASAIFLRLECVVINTHFELRFATARSSASVLMGECARCVRISMMSHWPILSCTECNILEITIGKILGDFIILQLLWGRLCTYSAYLRKAVHTDA
jgi:hypothetical protein